MKLHAVNVGLPRSVPARGGLLRTGIYKRPVTGRVQLGRCNLEGDGQADLKHHGGPHQAVYAYAREHYAWWARELGRDDLSPGQFGENLTVCGLREDEVCIGDVWRVGEALLQVSQPRIPCHKLAHRMGLPDFVKTFTQALRCGCYLRVLQTGALGAGDEVTLIEREQQPMSVAAVFRLRLLQPDDPEASARASQLPALSPEWARALRRRRILKEAIMQRRRLVISAIALVVVVAALSAPLWRPFFISDVVDEAFPALSAAERESLRDMPEAQREALLTMIEDARKMAADTARAMMQPDVAMQDDMPAAAPEPHALLGGSWIEIDPVHRAEGSATIWLAGEQRVLRFEDFRVTNGPQLHVLLTRNVPTSIFAGVGEDHVDLGPLKGNVGNQNYDIPADLDLSQYRSAVIYCVPFRVVFSSAELTDAGG